jgi:hypothetical protein
MPVSGCARKALAADDLFWVQILCTALIILCTKLQSVFQIVGIGVPLYVFYMFAAGPNGSCKAGVCTAAVNCTKECPQHQGKRNANN